LAEIGCLLKWLAGGKRHAFDRLAGKNPVGNFIHGLVTITIEWVAGQVKATATTQVTPLEPYHGPLSGTVDDGASTQH
jgi:hypothetical protein